MEILPDRKDVDDLTEWFTVFTNTSEEESEALRLNFEIKREHTKRVVEEITYIGNAFGLSQMELNMAEIIALLHDIGRFEQYRNYGTFSDHRSENHAELSLKIMKERNILHPFAPDVRELIYCSVRYHNRPSLPVTETARCLFWSKLLRDADKLDIWRVVTDYYHRSNGERNVALELELPDTPGISSAVFETLMKGEIVNMRDVRNLNDIKLLQAGWIYDINFEPSISRVRERRYIDLLKEVLPETDEVRMIFDNITSFMGNHN